jgi:hypothetical protein
MSFLCERLNRGRVFEGLPEVLLASLMAFFAVVRCSNVVCVRGGIVELGSSLVRVFSNILVPRTNNLISALRQFVSKPVSRDRASVL